MSDVSQLIFTRICLIAIHGRSKTATASTLCKRRFSGLADFLPVVCFGFGYLFSGVIYSVFQ